ncbi:MAG: LysR family transcriptional regulator [Burkholderiaceae bacterium]
MRSLSLDDFHLFCRIAATLSLSDVARERNVAASQISRALRRIETACGLQLAHRSTHGLSLTEEGDLFLEYAQGFVDRHQQLHDHLGQRSHQVGGVVHIGIGHLLAERVVIPRLPRLRATYPSLGVRLHIDDKLSSLVDDGLDIAVRAGIPPVGTMVAKLLGTHGRALYAAPAYLRSHGTPQTPADLDRHTLISNAIAPNHNRWEFRSGDRVVSRETEGDLQVDSSNAVVSLALAGAGIARLNDVVGRDLVARGLLVPVLTEAVVPGEHHIHAVVLTTRHRALKIKGAMDFLLQCFEPFRADSPA